MHKDNPLDSLTLPEVAAIFDGTDRSRGLIPVGLFPEADLGLFMRERVLQGNAFGPEFMGLPQSREVVARVGEDPRAIGFASACRAAPAVKMLALAEEAGGPAIAVTEENVQAGRYPLDRHLLIYVRSPIEPWVREFLRFVLSPDGQACIAAGTLGYLPLNPAEVAMELDKLKP